MLKPCGSKILVKKLSNETMTKGGIIMESATPFAQGEVLAVGPGRHNASGNLIEMRLKVGDIAYFYPMAMAEIEEGVGILGEEDVFAVK